MFLLRNLASSSTLKKTEECGRIISRPALVLGEKSSLHGSAPCCCSNRRKNLVQGLVPVRRVESWVATVLCLLDHVLCRVHASILRKGHHFGFYDFVLVLGTVFGVNFGALT